MTVTIYRTIIGALLIAVATLTALLLTQHTAAAATPKTITVVRTADDTSSFNDGYLTGLQNDCQQGFAPACASLPSN